MHTYVATDFPLRWARNATLVPDARLVGASILFTGWPGSKKFPATWTLVGTTLEGGPGLAGEGSARLAVYRSHVGPGGPYEQHPASPMALEGAVSAGRLFLKGKVIHRLGRSCPAAGSVSGGMRRLMEPRGGGPLTAMLDASAGCGPLAAFQLFISEEAIEQDTVELSFGRRLWRQAAAWDSAGYSFLDVVEVGKDAWAALASAHRLPYAAPALAAQLGAAATLLQAAGCLAAAAALVGAAAQLRHGALAARSVGRSLVRQLAAVGKAAEREAPQRIPVLQAFIHVDATARSVRAQPSVLQRRYQAQVDAAADTGKAGGGGGRGRRACRRLPWRTLVAAAATALTLGGAAGARFAMTLLQPFFAPPLPVPVARQYSKFSLLVRDCWSAACSAWSLVSVKRAATPSLKALTYL